MASAGDHAFEFVRRLQDHARSWSGDAGIFDRLDVRVLGCTAGGDGLEDAASIDAGMRVPPRYDIETLLSVVHDCGRDGAVEIQNVDAPVRTDRSSPLARRFVNAIRDGEGAPRFKLKTGTSDLNVLVPAWHCPAVAYGPGDSRLDHTPGEHIDIVELEQAVDVLDRVLGSS
jgi:LysW-gamma-L-lysine carboxypeptidase